MKKPTDHSKDEKIKLWEAIKTDIRLVLKLTDLSKTDDILSFLKNNEFGLAYEYLVEELADRGVTISKHVHKILQNLGQRMGFDKEDAESDMKDCWAIFLKMPVGVINVSALEVIFMIKYLDLSPELIDVLSRSSAVGMELDENRADSLRDLCSEKLVEIGFDQNYKLNDIGMGLQDLVDKLFIGKNPSDL